MSQSTEELIKELEMINNCYQVIADLITPGNDFQATEQDKLAMMLDFLTGQQTKTTEALRGKINSM